MFVCDNSLRCVVLFSKFFLYVCVIFHNKSAKKMEMHGKPLAQCKISLKKVVVGSVHMSFGDA